MIQCEHLLGLSALDDLCVWCYLLFYPTSAEALQSIIQLKGQKMMYEAWKGNYKVDEIRWTAEKAGAIVEEWQRKFTQVGGMVQTGTSKS